MFIDSNGLAINIYAPYTHNDVVYGDLRNPEVRQICGITEISDVIPPADFSDATYFVTHQQTAPYTIYTTRPGDQIAAAKQIVLVQQAQAALTESDKTILRCSENAVAVPAAWAAYRKALRAIVGGTDTTSTSLPTVPAYPQGT